MSLSFNRDTAVEATDRYIASATGQKERQPVTYSASSDTTKTAVNDFIMTGIYFDAWCADNAGASSAYMEVIIGGSVILPGVSIEGDQSTGVSGSLFVPIPDWFIPKGTPLKFNESATDGSATATIVGYELV